jgi:hypothetical protein
MTHLSADELAGSVVENDFLISGLCVKQSDNSYIVSYLVLDGQAYARSEFDLVCSGTILHTVRTLEEDREEGLSFSESIARAIWEELNSGINRDPSWLSVSPYIERVNDVRED